MDFFPQKWIFQNIHLQLPDHDKISYLCSQKLRFLLLFIQMKENIIKNSSWALAY